MEIKIKEKEVELLKMILRNLVVKSRTGEMGIIHGSDRFEMMNAILKKSDIYELEEL
ncbi:MAG TPA: hypothetical protein PK904_13495 [Bacteroidales bacterium]|nr:hypothetical protein [Bacteroidales bacterium]